MKTTSKNKDLSLNSILLGKELNREIIKSRILSIDSFGETPDYFQFVDWTAQDRTETIQFSFSDTTIGRLLIANTSKGICFLGFSCNNDEIVKEDFLKRFPKQIVKEEITHFQQLAIDFCNGERNKIIPLHLKGTPFQIDIWKKMTRIPTGSFSSYSALCKIPKGARAIGTAVGANPISYIIPCHRIVRKDGCYHGYHWGLEIKHQLIAMELFS
ncbi:methylated-DNA--[protein]-cysteine S-methyltransferase [Bacteroidales bacterium OttesenSCG-928-M11]|nr:methylated-DNA--[protein]-cysteine S-methyltransferase [Bacteroidales bacterium OttesenSCG-928-M11]